MASENDGLGIEKDSVPIPTCDLPVFDDEPAPTSSHEAPAPADSDYAKVASALFSLPPKCADDCKTWLKIGRALKREGEAYFSLWDAWSRQSTKYGRTEERWESLKLDGVDKPFTVASIFYMARQNGWQFDDEQQSPSTFDTIHSGELMGNDYSIEYLISDMLVRGKPTIVGAGSKTLKTSIAVDAVVSLTSGKPFLDRFKVTTRARCLMMSGESGLGTLQETVRRVSKAKGINPKSLDGLFWSAELPNLGSDADLNKLRRTLTELSIEVLVIDPVYLCFSGINHGDVIEQGKTLHRISTLCSEVGATLLLVHHYTKSAARSFSVPSLEDLSQAGFAEFARVWWLLGRREEYDHAGNHKLWLNAGSSVGFSGLYEIDVAEGMPADEGGRRWDVHVASHRHAQCLREEEQVAPDIEKVKALLIRHGALSANAIEERALLSRARVRKALESPVFCATRVPHPHTGKLMDGYTVAEAA